MMDFIVDDEFDNSIEFPSTWDFDAILARYASVQDLSYEDFQQHLATIESGPEQKNGCCWSITRIKYIMRISLMRIIIAL